MTRNTNTIITIRVHQINTNNTKHIYSTMHYETKNQKVHRTKELDSHITESGFFCCILIAAF